jgi:hypothetical protein
MVRTNLQEFVGDVHVLSNLQVGSNLFANDLAANVLTVDGSIGSTFFIGDGGLLSNIATTLNEIVANPGGNTVSNTLVFESGADATSNTAIATLSNVGISISNTEPTGEFQFAVGSNIFVNTHASNVLTVVGAIGSDLFIGDGGLLSNIATTLDQIVDQGNTVSNTIQLISGADVTSNTGLVTHKDVGISVSNTEPTGEFQFGVGSNLLVNVYSSNVLAIEGNVSAEKMTLGTITVTSAYGLNHVTAQGSVTGDTISLTNATTGLTADSNIVVGGNVTAETVITSANVEVGDRLKFASNVFVDDLRVADVAANLVTYDKTTGELMDSGGLFANKLAVVSVQPPSALSANTTTIAKHGTYTVTTSGLESTSNAWNAFDGDSAVEWKSIFVGGRLYNAGGLYTGPTRLATTTKQGEWLAIEFPYKTTLRHMKLTPPAEKTQYPASANVYATNDSLTWTELVNWSGVDPGDQQSNVQTIIVNATEPFKKYAMVVTKTNEGTDNTALAEWKLFTESFSIDGGQISMAQQPVTGGETTMEQSGPHSRNPKAVPLKKYPEIVFDASKLDGNDTANVHTQAGYTVSSSSSLTGNPTYLAFDGSASTFWHTQYPYYTVNGGDYDPGNGPGGAGTYSGTLPSHELVSGYAGEYITLSLPNKIKMSKISINTRYDGNLNLDQTQSAEVIVVVGSHDGSNWEFVDTHTVVKYPDDNTIPYTFNVNTSTYYEHVGLICTNTGPTDSGYNTAWSMSKLAFYGYEEDPPAGDTSVDTTFTSIMNTPQTTGANVYIDGNLGETLTNRVTGPDATGPSATYDETGKYWELNGELTSNLSVEANTFLSGDAPHSLSMWFNSSNLEANVSNTCVFSVSDQEKLDSVNLDLQSNTWHNLTYAYQGEGGSRVTYLDGRKVAEDQAEDTFGDYPPFAMTGYSQGGYVVSASSEYSSTYQQWEPYGEGGTDAGDSWISGPTQNYFGSGEGATGEAYTSGANIADTTVIDGVTTYGEWNQVEFPEKLHLSSVALNGINTTDAARYPRDAIVCASIDGITWTSIGSWTGEVNRAEDDIKHYTLNSTKAFKYVRIVVTKISTGYDGLTMLSRVRYYGHRENDLVRLPDPTNVLKYPHIAMTGPAQRGYVVQTSGNNATSNDGWKAFNGVGFNGQTNAGDHWITPDLYTHDTGAFEHASTAIYQPLGTGATGAGAWIAIKSPNKIKLTKLRVDNVSKAGFRDYTVHGRNGGGAIVGGTSWSSALLTVTDEGSGYSQSGNYVFTETSHNISINDYYNEFIIIITKKTPASGTGDNFLLMRELEFYGTEENSSIPIQIGGGNIDKVANFRVYDKFVGEDQALEIWDAQKDAFRGVKNSVTLHKGRLGIGTTEPEGRLAVLDEPNGLEEFPPRAMTGYKNYFEGHGEFCVSASSETNTVRVAWKAFDKFLDVSSSDHTWTNNSNPNYNGADNTYNPSVDGIILGTGAVYGEWIKLELPYKINLKYMKMNTRAPNDLSRMPEDFKVYGSNDNSNWTELISVTGRATVFETIHNVHTDSMYKYFGVVVTKISGQNNYFRILELRYFGTREQGQSVLHDGQLTLTKSLMFPELGRLSTRTIHPVGTDSWWNTTPRPTPPSRGLCGTRVGGGMMGL